MFPSTLTFYAVEVACFWPVILASASWEPHAADTLSRVAVLRHADTVLAQNADLAPTTESLPVWKTLVHAWGLCERQATLLNSNALMRPGYVLQAALKRLVSVLWADSATGPTFDDAAVAAFRSALLRSVVAAIEQFSQTPVCFVRGCDPTNPCLASTWPVSRLLAAGASSVKNRVSRAASRPRHHVAGCHGLVTIADATQHQQQDWEHFAAPGWSPGGCGNWSDGLYCCAPAVLGSQRAATLGLMPCQLLARVCRTLQVTACEPVVTEPLHGSSTEFASSGDDPALCFGTAQGASSATSLGPIGGQHQRPRRTADVAVAAVELPRVRQWLESMLAAGCEAVDGAIAGVRESL